MKTLIKQGYLLDPASKREGVYDLLIEDGFIKEVERNITCEADEIIDAQGLYVMPGFIDLHVHLREPGFEYKETIATGSRAAAAGGYTTICPMPNTKPVIDSSEMVEYLKTKSQLDSPIHIVPIGAVTKGQAGTELADINGMAKAGALAISEDGKSVMDELVYLEGMKEAAKAGIVVFAHCEDKTLVRGGVMNEGEKSRELHLPGITNAVEDVITARDIFFAQETKAKLHLCHCSTKASVQLVAMAKKLGIQVTGEVCPHHFTMSDDEITEDSSRFKMNPPLRSREDVQALKEGLRDNIMDVISTDHAPHSEEEKSGSMLNSPFGIVGSETAFALTMTELVKTGYLTPMQMVEKMSYNPAKVLGIDKGSLEVGKAADITIADPNMTYCIDKNSLLSKGKNTPFDGKEVTGKVLFTLVNGNIVYRA
ncbi:MAG: dihydroorotase [Clostridiales bacterium]|nr:dihydroorotase [Clostridiales bacterium]